MIFSVNGTMIVTFENKSYVNMTIQRKVQSYMTAAKSLLV